MMSILMISGEIGLGSVCHENPANIGGRIRDTVRLGAFYILCMPLLPGERT